MTQDNAANATDGTATPDEPVTSTSTEESSPLAGQSVSRRALLKGTASAAVGVTGLAVVSGTAAAGGWGECHHVPARAPSWFGYLAPWAQSEHNLPNATNGLTIYLHGFQTGRQRAVDDGHEVWRKLRDEGSLQACFSFVWPSGNNLNDWWAAKSNANSAGRWLGDYLAGRGWTAQHGKDINIICHSLGARVALECLKRLHEKHQKSIDTVHLLGGAIDYLDVAYDYTPFIEHGCSWMHNWYSVSDPVLNEVYLGIEEASPIGTKAPTDPPSLELTSYSTGMKQHCQYMDYNYGVIDDIAPTIQ